MCLWLIKLSLILLLLLLVGNEVIFSVIVPIPASVFSSDVEGITLGRAVTLQSPALGFVIVTNLSIKSN